MSDIPGCLAVSMGRSWCALVEFYLSASVGEPPDRSAIGEEPVDIGLIRHKNDATTEPSCSKLSQRARVMDLTDVGGEDVRSGVLAP